MLRSSLSDYSGAYILVTVTITVANTAAQDQPNNGANKEVIFKNNLPFTKCISRINNTQVDDAHDINVVMPMYNFIENSNNYSKTSGILWQYSEDKTDLYPADNNKILDFNANDAATNSFKTKQI